MNKHPSAHRGAGLSCARVISPGQQTWATLALSLATATVATAQTLPAPPVSPAPVVNYEYDAVGNPTKVIQAPGALNLSSSATYDSLHRAKDATDAKNGITRFQYDGQDRLTKVTDPRTLVTQYPRNGLGDATSLVSPDTGTATHTFDAAGNLKTRTDSRGVLSTYTYDALNRLTSVAHTKSGAPTETFTWTYDQTGPDYGAGKGRLGRADHPSGASRYIYDPLGRVTSDFQRFNAATGANSAQVVKSVVYTYDGAGNVTSILYPSGRKLTIGYSGGLAVSLSLAKDASSTASPMISNLQWEPFGGPRSWNWHMLSGTLPHSWSYDTSGRLIRYRLGPNVRDITYDAADRISKYTHYNASTAAPQASLDQTFGYDELGRLTSASVGTSNWTIGYDANGNRTGITLNGSPSSYTTATTSNRLTATTNPARAVIYDSAGSITGNSHFTAVYNLAGKMATLTKGGVTATYSYDNEGRRTRKFISNGTGSGAASTVLFVYDLHGQLLGEYDSTGKALREYVWLGDMPVAMFIPHPTSPTAATDPPRIYYFHTDHLNTPRVVVDGNNAVRWNWLAEPFGTTAPNTNPSGLGVFVQPLRFPGQYADQESGLFYNWNRYLDPQTGRYITSDPIGLAGGSFSTYDYVNSSPVSSIDPRGLAALGAAWGGRIGGAVGGRLGPTGAAAGRVAGATIGSAIEDACDCPGGYVRIYRVVGADEHASIVGSQQYTILPNGFGVKQFWLRMSDAEWFIKAEVQMQPSAAHGNRYVVASKICNDNLKIGFPFSDAGHNAISFDPTGLLVVNRDALMTGGIGTLRFVPGASK